MFRIIDRYIFREVIRTWITATIALLCILLTNQFARILGDVAKDKLPKDAIIELIALTGVQYLTILIPIGLFLSILIAIGRLYANSEMSALLACKVGMATIYRPVLLITIPLVFLAGMVTIYFGPKALLMIEDINNEARQKIDLDSIEPGRFIVDERLGTVIYAEEVTNDGELKNVFFQYLNQSEKIEVVIANRGDQVESNDDIQRYFVLYNGKRYVGQPGSTDYTIMEFEEHGIPYMVPEIKKSDPEVKTMKFGRLFEFTDRNKNAEFHWRIGIPISTLILALLAIPMSRSEPRQGQYNKIFIGVVTFIIYFNLLSAGKSWLENGLVDHRFGLWWVHVLMLFALSVLIIRNNNPHWYRLNRAEDSN